MKPKNFFILILLLIVGFASITTSLFINGIIKLGFNSDDFLVRFVNANIDGVDTPSVINSDGTIINYSTKELLTIGDASSLIFDVKNSSTQYDAMIEINCDIDNPQYRDFYSFSKNIPSIIKAGETKSGEIVVELIKSSLEILEEEFTCTITATPIGKSIDDEKDSDDSEDDGKNSDNGEDDEKDSDSGEDDEKDSDDGEDDGKLIVIDKGGNALNLGNKLSINQEDFYVISVDEEADYVYLLSALNVVKSNDSQEYEQKDVAMSEYKTAFSSSAFWKDTCSYSTIGNNLKVCNLLSHELIEKQHIVEYMAYQYGNKFGEGIKGRLMTVEEVLALAPNASKTIRTITGDYADIIIGADSKEGSLLYWLDTANDFRSLWAVYGSTSSLSSFGFSYSYYFGCRPVIEVPKNLIKIKH